MPIVRLKLGTLLWSFAGVIALGICLAVFVLARSAGVGSKPEGQRLARIQQSPEWNAGRFENPQPIWSDTNKAWRELAVGSSSPDVAPIGPIPIVNTDAAVFQKPPASGLRITWFGHSSALVEIDGTIILIDPIWSERASPVAWAGPKLWFSPPIPLIELPTVDAVVISHDHYDHLDFATIAAMQSWRTVFVVPLGVGAHLERWGISDDRIVELEWWQATKVGALQVVATPARHASGRLGAKSNKTLWAGFALVGPQHRVWYSGDTGLHEGLRTVGERLGPFDVTLIEAGQYNTHWPDTHLGPEQAVEAHREVRGKILIPVHWGRLPLAKHAWTEPVERVLVAAQCRDVKVLAPQIGESIEPDAESRLTRWWPTLHWESAAKSPVVATKNGDPLDRIRIPECAAP